MTATTTTYDPADYSRSMCGQGFIWRANHDEPGIVTTLVMADDPDYTFAHSLTYVEAPEGHRYHGTVNFIAEGTA